MGSEEARGELIAQATEWLIALDTGRADPRLFEEWRSADPRHAAAFAQIVATWEQTGALRLSQARPSAPPAETPAQNPSPPPPSLPPVEGERGQGDDFDNGEEVNQDRPPFFTRRRLLAGGGASALLAAAAPLYLHNRKQTLYTAVGERRSVRLPDGSMAELNTDSLLRWRFDKVRALWLEKGEIALSVLEDRLSPFVLYGGGVQATLDAGRYNIRLFDNGPELTVLSGRGEIVRPGAGKSILKPMHSISDRNGQIRTAEVSPDALETVSAWRRGEIIFDGMPLGQAVQEFNRYLDKKMVLADPAIGDIRLGGRFFTDDPTSFLRSLDQGFDIRAEILADSIRLHLA